VNFHVKTTFIYVLVYVFGFNKSTFFGFINIARIFAFVYFQVAGKTRKLCYRKDDRAMRAI